MEAPEIWYVLCAGIHQSYFVLNKSIGGDISSILYGRKQEELEVLILYMDYLISSGMSEKEIEALWLEAGASYAPDATSLEQYEREGLMRAWLKEILGEVRTLVENRRLTYSGGP